MRTLPYRCQFKTFEPDAWCLSPAWPNSDHEAYKQKPLFLGGNIQIHEIVLSYTEVLSLLVFFFHWKFCCLNRFCLMGWSTYTKLPPPLHQNWVPHASKEDLRRGNKESTYPMDAMDAVHCCSIMFYQRFWMVLTPPISLLPIWENQHVYVCIRQRMLVEVPSSPPTWGWCSPEPLPPKQRETPRSRQANLEEKNVQIGNHHGMNFKRSLTKTFDK